MTVVEKLGSCDSGKKMCNMAVDERGWGGEQVNFGCQFITLKTLYLVGYTRQMLITQNDHLLSMPNGSIPGSHSGFM